MNDRKIKPIGVRRGGRPSLEQAGKLDEKILNSATSLFFREGYGIVSIEEIVRQAQISKRTFYARYENKSAIFRAVVQRIIGRIRPLHGAEQLFEGADAREVLRRAAPVILRAALMPETLSLYKMLMSEASRFPELAFIMHEQSGRQEVIRHTSRVLERDAMRRNVKIVNPHYAAEQFLFLLTAGPQRRALGMGLPLRPEEIDGWAMDAIDLFLNGCWS